MAFFWPAVNQGPALKKHMGKMALGAWFSSVKVRGLSLYLLWPQNPDSLVNYDPLYNYDNEKCWTTYINDYVWTIRYRSTQVFQQTISQRGLIGTTCTFVSKIFGLRFCSPRFLTLFFIICLLATLCESQPDQAKGATRYFGIPSQTSPEEKNRNRSMPLNSRLWRYDPSLPPRFTHTPKDQ